MPGVRSRCEQALDERRHAVELVNVVGCRVAGEAHHLEAAALGVAEQLRPHRPPFEHRHPLHAERAEQPVGALGGAGKRAGEDFRVGNDEALGA